MAVGAGTLSSTSGTTISAIGSSNQRVLLTGRFRNPTGPRHPRKRHPDCYLVVMIGVVAEECDLLSLVMDLVAQVLPVTCPLDGLLAAR